MTYITSSESSVWCVGYYYPTNYRGKLILKIQSFPEGQGTLFTCVPILVYIYIYISGICAVYDYISSIPIVQGNPMFGMPAKYIFHSAVVGVEYYLILVIRRVPNHSHELLSAALNSGHAAHS